MLDTVSIQTNETLQVTQEHIDEGIPNDMYKNAVALALADHCGVERGKTMVGDMFAKVWGEKELFGFDRFGTVFLSYINNGLEASPVSLNMRVWR